MKNKKSIAILMAAITLASCQSYKKVPIVKLPTRLVALEFKPGSDNTVEMYLDNGWQLSFRIHNASTKVEPSLKFDVQFVSMPMEVFNIECRWN